MGEIPPQRRPTFDCLLQQQRNGTLVVDEHARRRILVQEDVGDSEVLLMRQDHTSAQQAHTHTPVTCHTASMATL